MPTLGNFVNSAWRLFVNSAWRLIVPADFNLSAPGPAPGPQRTAATRPWRPRWSKSRSTLSGSTAALSPLRAPLLLQQLAGAPRVVVDVEQQKQHAKHDHAQHETEDRAEHRAPDRLDTAEVRYPLIAAARSADDEGEETEIRDDFHALDDEPLHGTPPDRRRYRIGSERAAGDFLCRAEGKPRSVPRDCAMPSGEAHANRPWQCLYFLPEPHGQGSLRPTLPQDVGSLGLRWAERAAAKPPAAAPAGASASASSSSPVKGSTLCASI